MDNSAIAESFSLLSKLMDIHGENSFRSKNYSIAAYNIDNLNIQLKDADPSSIAQIKGIGESIGTKIRELIDTGELSLLNEYIMRTPPGVIEMLQIKGIGPKKIHTIWKEMEIESVGELLYACNENRLTRFKGFGEKTQQNVQEAIEFFLLNQGSFLYAQLEELFPQVDGYLKKLFSPDKVHVTGAYRRQDLTIDELEFVVLASNDTVKPKFQTAQPPELLEESPVMLLYRLKNGLKLKLHTGSSHMGSALFRTTGPEQFLQQFRLQFPSVSMDQTDNEADIFSRAGMEIIPPPLRGCEEMLPLALTNELPALIEPADIKGIIHTHSTWSDGEHSIEEMAANCIKQGFEYLVISDHSRAAAYAKGLSIERIREQQFEIDQLNARLQPFRIFKSIECDILNDGSLDYPDEILATFDLVIASVHSNLKMSEEKAMQRVMTAIANPYTTILGHPTGRLLLSRRGYPLDHTALIDACAANKVVIELNAHPRRLDIDWRYIQYAIQKNVLLSIDPDAHSADAFGDTRYGVLAAQKGGLTKSGNLSSMSLQEFEAFLQQRRFEKGI